MWPLQQRLGIFSEILTFKVAAVNDTTPQAFFRNFFVVGVAQALSRIRSIENDFAIPVNMERIQQKTLCPAFVKFRTGFFEQRVHGELEIEFL